MKRNKRILIYFLSVLLFAAALFMTVKPEGAKAAGSPKPVAIGEIDYEELTMKVYRSDNEIVYFSTNNRKTWLEADGEIKTDSKGEYLEMDISWMDAKSDVKIYFKGNKDETAVSVIIPKANKEFKVKYDKVAVDFDFDGYGESTQFMWRKVSDYNWTTVSFDKSSASYKSFLKTVNNLRFKGVKLVLCCVQEKGTDDENPGVRPSNEVKVSITKQTEAPLIKVDVKKGTVNTKDSYEFYNYKTGRWISCTKNMDILEIAPEVYAKGSGKGTDAKIKFRVAATDKKAASKTTLVVIPGQGTAPKIGDSGDVDPEFAKKKLKVTFIGASKDTPIEYCIVKKGYSFNADSAAWKSVSTANKAVYFTESALPSGCKLYFRFKGANASAASGTEMRLPSVTSTYEVTWPAKS